MMQASGLIAFGAAAALSAFLSGAGPAKAAEPVKVVASFSILGDFVREIGGDRVDVVTLVGPNGDAHVYEPSPADARAVAGAGLVVVNGLGFEGWLDRLVEASGYKGEVTVASTGIVPLAAAEDEHEDEHAGAEEHGHEGVDPHAWQSAENAIVYVGNVADALCRADAESCALFRANAERYRAELSDLDASIKASFAALSPERRKVITTHDAFGYFARAYGIAFLAPQGVSTDSEASAADVAKLITQIRDEGVTALFLENVSDPRLMEQIARETGIKPGGELYSDALSPPDGPAATYVAMMRHNAGTLLGAMRGS
ncbi:metal ABC transporter substrate-binding protein [Rhizobiales bacterium L72]|uniref:Metal ABC transporter substrate-binding protein n=2 Tax=Propylenella binzhouense TaxID=2555902 RepID=A0A964T5M8_9HYPH|nr:metal ABC transporter substrate-binding protein [Propylenella binzhouense]MYZ48269.1 metal ABC transporter substrate-binding protein [Propylenella binzhouense]